MSNRKIKIERATPMEHAEILHDLRKLGVKECENTLGPKEEEEEHDLNYYRKLLENDMNFLILLAFSSDGDVLGMVFAKFDLSVGNTSGDRHVAHIYSLFVRENYRNKGVGQRLMEVLMARLWDIEISNLLLEISSNDPRVLQFYKNLGFDLVGTMKQRYLVRGVYHDSHLMQRLLKGGH